MLRFFMKFFIREFSFFSSGAIIVVIFARFFNSRICSPREIREYNQIYVILLLLLFASAIPALKEWKIGKKTIQQRKG